LQRVRIALALLVVGAVGVAAPFAIAAISAGSSSSKVVTIKVTAKEFKFALSKRSVPKGTTVIFKVTNKGKIEHDFKVAGKKTKLLKPGQSATLKVVFKKKGKFGYVCTVKGHAAVGMKGTFGVGVTPPVTTVHTTTTATTATTTTGTTTTTPVSCTNPTSTVTVSMVEYAFIVNGVRNGGSVPAGCIQFNIKNDGGVQHNFNLVGIKQGAQIGPGATETWAVQLTAGVKNYTCDVPFHEGFGMIGTLTVT
jgi:uncharacterized cupredoxin-like copper-binding protein